MTRRPVPAGLLYGIAVYLVMNPRRPAAVSALGRGPFVLPVVINGLVIHMLGVGLPSALFARAARRT